MFLISSVSNFRDASIGSRMKKNVLFRCAKLSTLNKNDLTKLEKLKPHAIIDFRDPKEIKKAPDNLSTRLVEKYVSLPISASTLSRMVLKKKTEGDNTKTYENVMEESYRLYINNHKHVWKEFIRILLGSNSKPVIYHCSAGKDRTGVASYIIQKLLNNSMDLIYQNYLLSNQLLTTEAATAEQTTSAKKNDLLVTNTMLDTLAKVQKNYLLSAIHEIKNNYLSLENYVCEELKFDFKDIDKLKNLYLT